MTDLSVQKLSFFHVLVACFLGATLILIFYVKKLFDQNATRKSAPKSNSKTKAQTPKESVVKASNKKGKAVQGVENRWGGRGDKAQAFSHPWLLTSLKGHTGQVLDVDYSSDGKFLASCGEDRQVMLWCAKDLKQKDHKSLRVNIEFDHGKLIRWSPNTRAFIIHKATGNCVEVYRVHRKNDGWIGTVTKTLTFKKKFEEEIVGMGIANQGKFIMTCSEENELYLFDLKGNDMGNLDTFLIKTRQAKISPCGRYVAACGLAPDVKIWSVNFDEATGEFRGIKKAFDLIGHMGALYDFTFTPDGYHMASVSEDGTWRLFDTFEIKKGEVPRTLKTGEYERNGDSALIALSPNAQVVVIARDNSLSFYSTITGLLDRHIEDIFPGDIKKIMFDSTGRLLLACGYKHIHVFHNVTGYKAEIEDSKIKLRSKQTSATIERLEKIIQDNTAFLNTVQETCQN